MIVCLYVSESGQSTPSPGSSTPSPPTPVPDPVVPLLGRCSSTLLCRDPNAHCVNGTCVCLTSYFHDPTSDRCGLWFIAYNDCS